MKIQQKRREKLFSEGKPVIRFYQPDDAKWLWAAARRAGNQMNQDEFLKFINDTLLQADKNFILEDRNAEFKTGSGPVALVLATYNGWALSPHAEWFPWATTRNKLRCSIGFLQQQRYTRGVGIVTVHTVGEVQKVWFKKLRRYVPILFAGKIPDGTYDGDEYIFYLRGRENGRNNKRDRQLSGRRVREREQPTEQFEQLAGADTKITTSDTEHNDGRRVQH